MAKNETAAERYIRLNSIDARFHKIGVATDTKSSALEMATASGIDPARLFKTLIVTDDAKNLYCAVVPATHDLNRKSLARHLKTKRIDLADKTVAIKTTGYQMGACSPLGQKKKLPTFIDASATDFETIYTSGGAYGLEMEIAPQALQEAANAEIVHLT